MKKIFLFVLSVMTINISLCYGWSCGTHKLIAQTAGMKCPEYACTPDEARNENIDLMLPFHYHNPSPDTVVTPEYIDKYSVRRVNVIEEGKTDTITINIPHKSGVLYWKIADLYSGFALSELGSYQYNYYLMNIAHFIGDISQPLHSYPYKDLPATDGKIYSEQGMWAAAIHPEFDFVLDAFYPLSKEDKRYLVGKITRLTINNSDDMKREIAGLANTSIALANKCFREKRVMTKHEALERVAMSISVLKAVIKK